MGDVTGGLGGSLGENLQGMLGGSSDAGHQPDAPA
jgi:hypothetical protein